jgi:hypothetical protein
MPPVPPYSGKLFVEQHTIVAGSNFNGQGANQGYNDRFGAREFRPSTIGGLMDLAPNSDHVSWGDNDRVRKVMTVKLKLGGQSAWSISVASDDHPDIEWLSGTTETDFVHDEAEGFLHLAPNEQLKIVTTGASAELTAHVMYDLVGDPLR